MEPAVPKTLGISQGSFAKILLICSGTIPTHSVDTSGIEGHDPVRGGGGTGVNSGIGKVKAEGKDIPGHPWLHIRVEASLA